MRNIIWFIALFLLLLVQGGILMPLHINPVNLILVVVALAVILSDFNQGLVITVMGGLMLDFVSGSPDGLVSITLLIVYLIMRMALNEILSRDSSPYILVSSVAASVVIYFWIFLAVDRLFGILGLSPQPEALYLLSVKMPLMIMWNLIFAYPIFRFYLFVQNLASRLPHSEESIKI